MNSEVKERYDALQNELQSLKKPDLKELIAALTLYNEMGLHLVSNIRAIKDYDTAKAFFTLWKQSGKIATIPKRLVEFTNYQSKAAEFNDCIANLSAQGQLPKGAKLMAIDEDTITVTKLSESFLSMRFDWNRMKELLVGEKTKEAIYTHVIAALPLEDVKKLMEEGILTENRITALPYHLSIQGTLEDKEKLNGFALQKLYRNNLEVLYRDMGKQLPSVVTRIEPVKGVTFDGVDDRLRYIVQKLGEVTPHNLYLAPEPYMFKRDGVEEPAVRILGTIAGSPDFNKLPLGHLDRNLANTLYTEHKDATLTLAVKEIGFMQKDGQEIPFMKVTLDIVDKPQEIVKESAKEVSPGKDAEMVNLDYSEEMTALLDL